MSQNKAPFIFIIVTLVTQLVFLNGCSNQQAIQKAAEEGDAYAQYQTGFNYENGLDVPRDSKKAIYWYQLSAKQGNSWAQNNLHNLTGQGTTADTQKTTSNKTSSTAPSTALNQEAPKSNESKNVSYPSEERRQKAEENERAEKEKSAKLLKAIADKVAEDESEMKRLEVPLKKKYGNDFVKGMYDKYMK